eukprot:COSAG01_NODE_3968_length_5483_cov_4.305906_9_plen_108_part_00
MFKSSWWTWALAGYERVVFNPIYDLAAPGHAQVSDMTCDGRAACAAHTHTHTHTHTHSHTPRIARVPAAQSADATATTPPPLPLPPSLPPSLRVRVEIMGSIMIGTD